MIPSFWGNSIENLGVSQKHFERHSVMPTLLKSQFNA